MSEQYPTGGEAGISSPYGDPYGSQNTEEGAYYSDERNEYNERNGGYGSYGSYGGGYGDDSDACAVSWNTSTTLLGKQRTAEAFDMKQDNH